jgi:general secretion pathway protein F
MPAYRFEALDLQGHTVRDLIEADSERAARQSLRSRQLLPISVSAVSAVSAGDEVSGRQIFGLRRVFTPASRTVWTRQLAGLLVSGLPLERALTALMEESEARPQRELLALLRSEVNAGAPFAQALARAPREFDSVYRAVVAAGEQTGALGQVLESLADDLEAQQALKGKLLAATLYPAIVSILSVVIVVFLVTYVVPQVASVFAGSKRSLPGLTVFMLAVSGFIRHQGWLLLILGACAGLGLHLALKLPTIALRADAAWLRLPLVGRLARGYNAARFAGTLAMLAAAGVPILKSLQAAADTLSNRAMKADALQALVQVREGAPLASALADKRRFPGLLAMFARLGEQTGNLPLMLQRAAGQLSGEVQRRAMALATVLEPLLIVGMGGMVMLIVLAVLLPIIELNTWVR